MIRVLHYGLDSKLGGIETYLHKLYTHIDTEKFQFDFLTIGDEDPCWYEEFTKMGSDFYKITPRSSNPFRSKKDLLSLFKEENFDIIHCHLNTLSYISPIQVALDRKIPVIVHSRNAGASKSTISNFLHKVNSIVLPRDKISMIAVSDLAGKWLFGDKAVVQVINNGLEIEKYRYNEVAREKVRREFGLKDELVILHLGAMRSQKNHMFLLEIFKKILTKKTSAKLLLVGDGELKKDIEDKISELQLQDNIIIAGKRNDVPNILSAADFFLFPSLFEGFPNAVLEAQTSGLPCLISDVITKEVVVNDNCNMMSLNKSTDEWAVKLLSLKQFNDRKIAATNIRNKGFSVEDEVEKIEEIYKRLYHLA